MFEKNWDILAQVIEDGSAIRHISKHRKPDGTFDLEGNKQIWNNVITRFKQVPLWENGAPGFDGRDPLQTQPSIIFIPAKNRTEPCGTIVVAHGGGFESRTGCEGIHVADWFARQGFNCAILTYRLKPYTRRDAIADMQRAIRLIRANRASWGATEKVAAMGFSAGGMLSGNCATHFDYGDPAAADPAERESCRPDAAVLGYAAFATLAFPGPFFLSPFEDPNREEKVYLAPENNLTAETPPFFIWQTNGDDPRNAFVLGSRLTEAGIPFELHCFPDGKHGLGLADGNNDLGSHIPHVMHWAELCAEWLRQQGI